MPALRGAGAFWVVTVEAVLLEVFHGACIGFGSAIGTGLATKYALEHLDRFPRLRELVFRSRRGEE